MDAKLNHSDLSALLAKQAEISGAKAELFTKAFFDIILEGLEKDGVVKINGLGTFKITDVASRSSVDVNTGEKIEIKGHKKLTFLPADILKDKVNQPFAMFEPVEIDESYVDDSEEPAANETKEQENAPVVENDIPTTVAVEEGVAEEVVEALVVEVQKEEAAETVPVTEEKDAEPVENAEPVVVEDTENKEFIEQPITATAEVIEPAPQKTMQSYPLTEQATETEEPKNTKNSVYITLLIIATILVGVAIYFYPQLSNGTGKVTKPEVATVRVASTPVKEMDNVAPDSALTTKTATEERPYTFAMLDELATRSVGSVGRGDTLLYVADGTITTHTVAADETLVRISLKYYGDKRLWPYIVQYNKLDNPNGLSKGMELNIPRLQPAK